MKYVPTIHSKVRYSQRVNPRDTMDETVLLAKKYGVRIEDIPLEHDGIRGFMGHNKIPVKFKENLELKNTMKELSEDLCDGCKMAEYKEFYDPKWIKKYMPYY